MGRADLATETERTRRRGRAQLPTECPFPRLCLLVAIPGLFPAVDARPIRPISAPDQSHPSLSPATARPPRPRLSPTLDLPLSPCRGGLRLGHRLAQAAALRRRGRCTTPAAGSGRCLLPLVRVFRAVVTPPRSYSDSRSRTYHPPCSIGPGLVLFLPTPRATPRGILLETPSQVQNSAL